MASRTLFSVVCMTLFFAWVGTTLASPSAFTQQKLESMAAYADTYLRTTCANPGPQFEWGLQDCIAASQDDTLITYVSILSNLKS
jgi:hypothetical protein